MVQRLHEIREKKTLRKKMSKKIHEKFFFRIWKKNSFMKFHWKTKVLWSEALSSMLVKSIKLFDSLMSSKFLTREEIIFSRCRKRLFQDLKMNQCGHRNIIGSFILFTRKKQVEKKLANIWGISPRSGPVVLILRSFLSPILPILFDATITPSIATRRIVEFKLS